MRRGKAILVSVLFLACMCAGFYCYGRGEFQKKLDAYTQWVRGWILQRAESDSFLKRTVGRYPNMVIIPYCRYRGNRKELFKKGEGFDLLKIDTMVRYGVYTADEKMYVIAEPRSFHSDFGVSDYTSTPYDHRLLLVQHCEKYSRSIFWLNVLNEYGHTPFVAYIQRTDIKLFDADSVSYNGIDDYLLQTFGSLEKYAELVSIEQQRKALLLKMVTLEDAKKILRDCYVCWARSESPDTDHILNLFFKEVDSLAQLKPAQLALLKRRVTEKVKSRMDGTVNLKEDDLLEKIAFVLTFDQYSAYHKQLYITNWLRSRALEKVEQYYFYEKGFSIEKEDEILRKEVYYE